MSADDLIERLLDHHKITCLGRPEIMDKYPTLYKQAEARIAELEAENKALARYVQWVTPEEEDLEFHGRQYDGTIYTTNPYIDTMASYREAVWDEWADDEDEAGFERAMIAPLMKALVLMTSIDPGLHAAITNGCYESWTTIKEASHTTTRRQDVSGIPRQNFCS